MMIDHFILHSMDISIIHLHLFFLYILLSSFFLITLGDDVILISMVEILGVCCQLILLACLLCSTRKGRSHTTFSRILLQVTKYQLYYHKQIL